MEEYVVSILCATYNHEKYIRQAIESFLAQKTNFKFEILVHDDASIDGTADIIRQLSNEYPNRIFPIFQVENQYSKGVIILDILLKAARGKYIAICEGDDYWSNPDKLQLQVEWLEAHSDYSACVHNTKIINCENRTESVSNKEDIVDRDFTLGDILSRGAGLTFHTSSVLARREYISQKPEFYYISMRHHIGDFPLAIWYALNGKIRYLSKTMSVYRRFSVPSSWSVCNKGFSQNEARLVVGMEMFESVKGYVKRLYDPSHIYTDIIDECILKYKWELLLIKGEYRQLRKAPYNGIYKKMPILQRLWLYIKQYLPGVYCVYMKLRGKEASIPEYIKQRSASPLCNHLSVIVKRNRIL